MIRLIELFAGVGGFRLGLEGYHDPEHPELGMPAAGEYATVWANQWEPDGQPKKQFAWECYTRRFGKDSCVNRDISIVLDDIDHGEYELPGFDMLVGGFPCQDYSVARPSGTAQGIQGRKGVLWWSIDRLLARYHPRLVLLENVDRLLWSPKGRAGRDFAIILTCLARHGYMAEWRTFNAADYGLPQKRRRTWILARHGRTVGDPVGHLLESGVLARAFPCRTDGLPITDTITLGHDPVAISDGFNIADTPSPFHNAGIVTPDGQVGTIPVTSTYDGPRSTLKDCLDPPDLVPDRYWVDDPAILARWRKVKGEQRKPRVNRDGIPYVYSQGALPFPDRLDSPGRTLLTETGLSPSRTRHIIRQDGRHRLLTPREMERLQTFPPDWTSGLSDSQRAFTMGNALITRIPHRIGRTLIEDGQ